MKIFISHASANKQYGNALVELLRGVGIGEDQIIFTSNAAYGIPLSQNIFKWLKSQISEKPFVIYLLSKEYYASIACLNEMGAAWMIENEHAIIFTPGFELTSKEFQNGAIDPREMGFFLDNQERLLSFIQLLQNHFTISKNAVIHHQKTTNFLKEINEIAKHPEKQDTPPTNPNDSISKAFETKTESTESLKVTTAAPASSPAQQPIKTKPLGLYDRFINDITTGKLKDEELMLLHYIIDAGKIKLFTGWQEDHEVKKIVVWEEVNELNNLLSNNYSTAIGRFDVRGFTEVSAVTSSNNPKEVKLKAEIGDNILYLPDEILEIINKAVEKNKNDGNVSDTSSWEVDDRF